MKYVLLFVETRSSLTPHLGLAFCGPGLAYELPLIYDISR